MASSAPRIQSTSGFGSTRTMSPRSQYFGEIALFVPLVPGATLGQFSEAVASPG
jgi:hypothetical protein